MMRKALLVVDMQYAFMPGYSLPVQDAWEIVPAIEEMVIEYIEAGQIVVFTKCNHPPGHVSFQQWGSHALQGTKESLLLAGLEAMAAAYRLAVFNKGEDKDIEQTSGFDNLLLRAYLKKKQVVDVSICGVARSVCVQDTFDAAVKLGFDTTIIERLCKDI